MWKFCVFCVFGVENAFFWYFFVAKVVHNDAKLVPNDAKVVQKYAKVVPNDAIFCLFLPRIHTNEHKLTTTEYTEVR